MKSVLALAVLSFAAYANAAPQNAQICPALFEPVCGKDRRTYSNECLAKDVGVDCKGNCPCKECDCDLEEVQPICGQNNKTYTNACFARCETIDKLCDGECPCPCECAEIYQPICGTDGKTYSSVCEAACGKVVPECNGECPCQDLSQVNSQPQFPGEEGQINDPITERY